MKYEIGARIKYFRELRGFNQKELASKIGVSNTRVSNWEQGINRPDADTLVLLCQVLEVSADEMLETNALNMRLTKTEGQLITQYRNKPEMQPAIKKILDIEEE